MRIFNASPLILLLEEIKEPEVIILLKKIDNQLLVPKKVTEEITSRVAKSTLEDLVSKKILIICNNGEDSECERLKDRFPGLDDGETNVLCLAYQYEQSTAIIDESKGREVAIKLGIGLKGAFGLMLEIYKSQLIPLSRLKDMCRKIDKSRFRINFKEIGYEWVLK